MATQQDQTHPVLGTALNLQPSPDERVIYLAAGCFWGVERIFWEQPGVIATAVGYMGGTTPAPSYVEVCTGVTGHAEAVRVVYDTAKTSVEEILAVFFENHDPTTKDRQGNDRGTQYRSEIWTTTTAQFEAATKVAHLYDAELARGGFAPTVTRVNAPPPPTFYYAEDYHQAYLHKNPNGYCNHGFNGVACPRPT